MEVLLLQLTSDDISVRASSTVLGDIAAKLLHPLGSTASVSFCVEGEEPLAAIDGRLERRAKYSEMSAAMCSAHWPASAQLCCIQGCDTRSQVSDTSGKVLPKVRIKKREGHLRAERGS